jgi:tetratricopeptide (TPR) repeat protein
VRMDEEAMRMATDLGARDLTKLDISADYVQASSCLVATLDNLGRDEDARRAGADSVALAEQVLDRRPGYRVALLAEKRAAEVLADLAATELDPLAAVRLSARTEQLSLALLNLDPGSIVAISELASARKETADYLWAAGRLAESIPYYRRALDDFERAAAAGGEPALNRAYTAALLAMRLASMGDAAGAGATLAASVPRLAKLRRIEPEGSNTVVIADALGMIPAAAAAFEADDLRRAQRLIASAVNLLKSSTPEGDVQKRVRAFSLYLASQIAGRTEYQLGNFKAAAEQEREALAQRGTFGTQTAFDRRELGEVSTWLAMALARQGRTDEATRTIAPVVALQRQLAVKNHDNRWLPLELASALYAQALADPPARAALLKEATALVDGLFPTLRALHDVRQWRERIRKAQQGTLPPKSVEERSP